MKLFNNEKNLKKEKLFVCIALMAALALSISASATSAGAFFSDGFESGDLSHTTNGAKWKSSNHQPGDSVTVSDEISYTGKYSLKFHYKGRPLGKDGWAEQRFYLGKKYTGLYVRFYIHFPLNFEIRNDPPANNKIIYVWGSSYGNPSDYKQSQEVESSGFLPKSRKVYVSGNDWNLDCSGGTGTISNIQGIGFWPFSNLSLGKWLCFEYHFKLDSGVSDGAMEFWVDGEKKYGKTNLSWIGAPCSPGYFLNGYLMGWANSGYSNDTDIYIDNVVFSTTYIGPIGTRSNADNGQPKNLRIIDRVPKKTLAK